jgi:hypothetical protein
MAFNVLFFKSKSHYENDSTMLAAETSTWKQFQNQDLGFAYDRTLSDMILQHSVYENNCKNQ